MISKDCAFYLSKRGLHRLHLMQNVDAIAVINNHLRDAPHLALDPFQAIYGVTAIFSHKRKCSIDIPYGGIL
jgi:hypothetical protein